MAARVGPYARSRRGLLAKQHVSSDRTQTLLLAAALISLYVGAAHLGLQLSVAHGVVTPVWAPTGIALAALVLFGRRLWPAVLLAAFVANATSGAPLAVAAAISVGNTLEAVVGCELLRRARFRPSLDRVRDVFALIVLGAAVSTTVSATNGVTTLWIADELNGSSYRSQWLLWWIGDAMGDLLVASLFFVLATTPSSTFARPARRLEALLLLGLLGGFSAFVFFGGYWRYPHLIFPLLIWATLRFRQTGAVVSSFVVSAIAIAGAVGGHIPLADRGATDIVQILEGLLAGVTISVLVLGAVLAEREAAGRQLERAHARLAEAQAVAHIGSWEWDMETDRVTWSDELYRLFGLQPGSVDVTYESFLQFVHPKDRERVSRIVARAASDGQPFSFEHRIAQDDGSIRWLQARGNVVLDESGTPTRMLGTSQDVTDRKRLDELRETILSTVSHELRTPLTAILGFTVTLQQLELSRTMRDEILANLAEQARRLERLLTDLLDLDRLRRGFVTGTFVNTDVGELVKRVASDYTSGVRAIRVATVPAAAEVDAPKIERVVDNLIANAVRHTPPATEIAVSVERRNGGVLIAVDDQGPGIPRDERETIFEIFRRGARADTRGSGIGVGLSLVHQFTALHGGRVWVEESAGGGASFRVFLPARQPT